MELLAIVQAEAEADRILQEANARKEASIKQAHAQRKAALDAIARPEVHEQKARHLQPHIDGLKATAHRNKAKAVKLIMEEIHA